MLELRKLNKKFSVDSFGYNDFLFFEAFTKGLINNYLKLLSMDFENFLFGIGLS